MKQAPDPTIVIHENTDVGKCGKRLQRAGTYTFLILLGYGYLQLLIWISQMTIEIGYIQLPPGINCEQFENRGEKEMTVLAYFQYLRFNEYYQKGFLASLSSQMNLRVQKEGYMQCFCTRMAEEGRPKDQVYESPGPEYEDAPICDQWTDWLGFYALLVKQGVKYIIVIMTVQTRFFFMKIGRMMGFKNKAQKYKFIKNGVFWGIFLQTGVLCMLAFWDMRFKFWNWGPQKSLFGGLYTDFNADWFNDAGLFLLATYKVQILFPVVEFFMRSTIRNIKRICDQKKCWPNKPYRTHSPTIRSFVDKYLGQQFWVHYKYSTIMAIIYIAFLFGTVMPVLFPLCFLGLCVMYVVERLMIHYSYRKPPMIDDSITQKIIIQLYIPPALFMGLGAYALANQHIFRNVVAPLQTDYVFPNTTFAFPLFFLQFTPATVLIIGFVVFTCFFFIKRIWPPVVNRIFCMKTKTDVIKVIDSFDAGMVPYSDAMKAWQKSAFNSEYVTGQNRLGLVKPLYEEQVDIVRANIGKENASEQSSLRLIQNTTNYDILASGAYRFKFAYVPPWWKDRMSYIATPKYDMDCEGQIRMKDDAFEGNIYTKRDLVYGNDGTQKAQGPYQPYTVLAAKAQSDYVRLIVDLAYLPKKEFDDYKKKGGFTTEVVIQKTHDRVGVPMSKLDNSMSDLGLLAH